MGRLHFQGALLKPPRSGIAGWAIYALGWLLGRGPEFIPRTLCWVLGRITFYFSSRRHVIIGQLQNAFPDRDPEWCIRIARLHCARMFEMFLLILAMPHWSVRKMKSRISADPSIRNLIEAEGHQRPIVFFIPHSTLMEGLTSIMKLVENCPDIITLYRPLDYEPAEQYVLWARKRWGAELVARKEGLVAAKRLLAKGKGIAGILFDQSSNQQGVTTLFMGKACSTTNLPALLTIKYNALPIFLYGRRTGFWRGRIEGRALEESTNPGQIMAAANQALENVLSEDDSACADWFWAHKRWKGMCRDSEILKLHQKKSYLEDQLEFLKLTDLPQKTKIAIRLPKDPRCLPAARRFVQAISLARPDAQIWILSFQEERETDWSGVSQFFRLSGNPKEDTECMRAIDRQFPDGLFVLDPDPSLWPQHRMIRCETRAGVSHCKTPKSLFSPRVVVSREDFESAPFQYWRSLLDQSGMPPEIYDRLLPQDESSPSDASN